MSERITDIGPPHFSKFLPPVIKENYGKWKYHTIPEPGVLLHVSESGAELYTGACRFSPGLSLLYLPGNCATLPKNIAAAIYVSPAVIIANF